MRAFLITAVCGMAACGGGAGNAPVDAALDRLSPDARADAAGADGRPADAPAAADAPLPADGGGGTDGGCCADARADANLADAGVADASLDAPVGCAPAAPFAWRAAANTAPTGDVRVFLYESPDTGGMSAYLLLYSGPQGPLGQLPRSHTVSCTMGMPVCEASGWAIIAGRQYALFSGTLTLSEVTSPLSSEVKATIASAVFRETYCASVEGGCVDTFKPGGGCYEIDLDVVDTTVAIGKPCASVDDCGTFGKACSVPTSTCAASECNVDADCGAGKACVPQHVPHGTMDGVAANACYARCDPTAPGPCGAGAECIRRPRLPPTVGEWTCMPVGSGVAGGGCMPRPGTNSTGCAKGLTCREGVASQCVQRCDSFQADPGCAAGARCVGDRCVPPLTMTDPATIGQTCAGIGLLCADDGKAYRGICSGFSAPYVCRAACEVGGTCAAGTCSFSLGGYVCQ